MAGPGADAQASAETRPDKRMGGRLDGRVGELDLLRFIAALVVVLFHYAFRGYAADGYSPMPYPLLEPVIKYGYLGVELFFLISGFVILMTAASGSLRDFALSRMVRLYPAFWACCTVTFLVLLLAGKPVTASQYLANLTMLSGFAGIPSIDGVYWSLFVEIKFYAMVALVLLLGRIHQAQLFMGLWLLAALALAIRPVGILNYLLVADYAPYFVGGAACYLIRAQGWTASRGLLLGASWLLALHLSVDGLDQFRNHYRTDLNPLVIQSVVSLFFATMLLVALRRTGPLARMRWITLGALTYPLYLLHQNIGYQIFTWAYPTVNAHLLLWGTVALMLAASYGVHRAVEKPLAPLLRRSLTAALDRGRGLVERISSRGPVVRAPAVNPDEL